MLNLQPIKMSISWHISIVARTVYAVIEKEATSRFSYEFGHADSQLEREEDVKYLG